METRFLRHVGLICAALGLALAPAYAAPPQERVSAAAFVAPPAISDPALSPDGHMVAARAMVEDVPHLALYDLRRSAPPPRAIPIPESERLEWYGWNGPDSLIVSLLRQGAHPNRQFAALDIASGTLRQIGGARAAAPDDRILHVDPAGIFLLIESHSDSRKGPAVHRVELATGADTLVVAPQPGVREWVADSAGVVRAGFGAKDGRSWLLYRKHDGDRFDRTRDADEALDLDASEQQFMPVEGRDLGFALAEGPHGRIAVYGYDFGAGKLGGLVHEDSQVDLDGFEIDAAGRLIGVQRGGERDETTWLDPRLAARQAKIDKALPGRANRIVDSDRSESRLLILSSTPQDPGAYYLYAGGRAALIARINPALGNAPGGATREIRYAARDGLDIPAYLTLPAGREAKGLPLIVMPHGGPYARDGWGYDPWTQYLAALGYAVLRPNYRGSTGHGPQMVAAGDGQWGRGMQDDVDDGVAWLAKQGIVDAGRVCIMGASYGAYAAMWVAARDTGHYRCAVAFAGISDVKAQLDYDRKTFAPGDFRSWRQRIQGSAPSLDSLSPMHFVEGLRIPILIAHGTEDQVVPPSQSERLHAALTKLGRAHDYIAYPGEGHNIADPAHEADFLDRVGAFLAAHNPP